MKTGACPLSLKVEPRTYGFIGIVVLLLFVVVKCVGSEETIRAVITDAETGLPMAGVEVEFRFPTVLGPGEGWGRGAPIIKRVTTNAQGFARASGPINDNTMGVRALAEGYWNGGAGVDFSPNVVRAANHGLVQIALRPKRNPQAMYARHFVQTAPLQIPVANEHVGFDLQRSDWLPPHGEGEHADLIFHMVIGEKHGEIFPMDYGQIGMLMDVHIVMSFPEGGGIIAISPEGIPASSFKWPYEAPVDGYEEQHSLIAKRLNKNDYNDVEYSWRRDRGLRYIFRTRPQSTEGDDSVQFHYGRFHEPPRIHFVDWQDDPARIGLSFSYTFNPIPGERSMEFDVSRNLFKGSGLVPSQYLGGFQP